ncbi:MAG: sugar phosphate isomerase/epimerase family protein, partial [Pseudomonadota bacterium]
TIGAALMIEQIAVHRDWLFEADRDLEIQDFVPYAALKDGPQETIARAKAALDGFRGRLGIHGPYRGLEIDNADPEIREVILRRYTVAIEAAAVIGARQMVIHSPFNIWSHHHRHDGMGRAARMLADVTALLEPMLAVAEREGVVLVVENCEDAIPETRRELVQRISSPALALSIDTGHAQLSRRMYGAPPVDVFVRDAGALLRHVHLQDLDGYADRHWAPGDGEIEWPAVFRALAECESAPHLVLELHNHADVPKGFAYLRDLGLVQ